MAKINSYSVEFKKKTVREFLQNKDQFATIKEFSHAHNLNESTFGQWVNQYEPLLTNAKVNQVFFRDFISMLAPFSQIKVVASVNLCNVIFSGNKRDIDEEFMFLYGDRVVEMAIPSTETLIIFS